MHANRTLRPVLVVDDEAELRDVIEWTLADAGYPVLSASDGQAALDLLRWRLPSLILLDMRMPRMDGWAFARAYRQLPRPHAPMIVVSAATNVASWAREIDADGCLAKPFELR
jgi:CheY-like chemotaxis protein